MPGDLRGLLAAAVAAVGGVERAGQVRMAEAVEAAIAAGEHLVVQAGTGTGKSLAYLVPALAHALRADEPVVVATATLALQGQLIDRDLPTITAALAEPLGRRATFAMLKGRSNYLCLHRLNDGVPDDQGALVDVPLTTPLGREVQRLREWAGETASGDRDDAPTHSERAWAQVSVSARECLGAARCPYADDCFAERAREAVREADVVVTNHALLAIDTVDGVPVLPEHGVIVIDEAHELPARVTGTVTDELSSAAINRAARRCRPHVETDAADELDLAGVLLDRVLAAAQPGRVTAFDAAMLDALVAVRDAASALVSAFSGTRDRGEAEEEAARRQARALAEDVLDVSRRLVDLSLADVAWVAERDRSGAALRVAPLSVAGLLRSKLFARRTVVLTSATLTIGGDFDAFARSVGLLPGFGAGDDSERDTADDSDDAGSGVGPDRTGRGNDRESTPRWRGVDVGTPFDPARQGILYIARHLPTPGRDGLTQPLLDELAGLMEAAGGRTLGLFSSMRAARAAAEAMRERLSIPILCQGDDSLVSLVHAFASDAATSLFGTLSLWQGVDVPGSACQLVVIDRIPFPRPDDPLMSARAAAVSAAGGNGFMAVSAAHAALLLAQGTGRLIRSMEDRGVVAVLDPRLATARYAGYLRASLPPLWVTVDPQQVRRSLAAINASAAPVLPVGERPKRVLGG